RAASGPRHRRLARPPRGADHAGRLRHRHGGAADLFSARRDGSLMPRLCVVGLSHKTAPIEVRERAAFPDDAIVPALAPAVQLEGVGEAMIVSTCNRVELYSGVDGADALTALEQLFDASVRSHLYKHDGDPAVRHLLEVACSLDSMVVGESQILGQVKHAYA